MNWDKELIKEANEILNKVHGDNIEPSKENALRFFNMNPEDIKVVILGQDPYPTPGVANGRAFAVNEEIKVPQSLKNIFKEIDEVLGSHEADKTLLSWEEQGVLLLNTSLTVKQFEPNSHKAIWKPFTDKLIKWIDDNTDVVWILWGNEAKKYSKVLNNRAVMDAHPSPLSVRHRKKNTFKEVDFINW